MGQTRSWAQPYRTLRTKYERYRTLRTLTRGQQRLHRWKKWLTSLMKEIRLRIHQRPEEALEVPGLPMGLLLGTETLRWALTILEDLFLLLQELETQVEQSISRLSKQD